MVDVPSDGYWESGARKVSEAKAWGDQIRDFLAQGVGGAAVSTLAIGGDAATPAQFLHALETEGAAAADDLKNLLTANVPDGSVLLLTGVNPAHVVTVRDAAGGAGQIHLAVSGGTFVIDAADKFILLRRVGPDWYECLRFFGADLAGLRTFEGTASAAALAAHFADVANPHATTAAQVAALALSGGTLTGALTLAGPPTVGLHAASKNYVDSRAYVQVEEQQPVGTAGGSATGSAFDVRAMNTEVSDAAAIATVAANQITLAAGTYEFEISAPAYKVNAHRVKLYNVTDAADVKVGTSEWCNAATEAVTRSVAAGRFTIATTKTFEIRHFARSAQATNGFGIATNDGSTGVEVYAVARFWRLPG